ncbi:Nif3-like dinuclear metal center hexameric protein [Paenibacillus hexagrammi]|uniref:GTP cyclohydrolase 1 type 2 homolog n=1 Tax=Paenibacillus hexagrammi TaxID=2908839 RepID=A0ABY3SJI4_9BACL|nr:Nif3-like dinuclear metal center hexameric protein [Paenibacillus sp. YPD9-1]UJF33874.1 Nif3-like dinuclear metal center hexameric protein [Paenibacillus sp. YPD9-1]
MSRLTIQDVVDHLIKPVGQLEQTVDRLLVGDPDAKVTGIAVAFMPTQRVIEQMIEIGANLLISHEGLAYSHHFQPEILEQDPVFQTKRSLLEEAGIAVFRFHDYIHRYQPDAITAELVRTLEWQPYVLEHQQAASIVKLPAPSSLGDLAAHVKKKLGIPYMRAVGDLEMPCERIGILVGYRGGGSVAIPLYEREELDVIIAGEGPEWETPEYVRDAVHQGKRKALLVIGHAESEEPGMAACAEQLKTVYPSVPVRFLRDEPIFQVLL